MLQWLPGSASQVIWNDREGDRFISQILDIETGERRRLAHPVYALSPDGRYAVGTDFRRIQAMRPGYGYAVRDIGTPEKVPEDVYLYRLDLATDERHNLLSLAEVAAIPFQEQDISDGYHWFNHLLVGPDSERFIFLHRWRGADEGQPSQFHTRMFTVAKDGRDLYCVDDGDYMSHFIWRDPNSICAWAKPSGKDREAFYLFKDKTSKVEGVGHDMMIYNGHSTYLPGTNSEWILNDTYPLEDRFSRALSLTTCLRNAAWNSGAFTPRLPMRASGAVTCTRARAKTDARSSSTRHMGVAGGSFMRSTSVGSSSRRNQTCAALMLFSNSRYIASLS